MDGDEELKDFAVAVEELGQKGLWASIKEVSAGCMHIASRAWLQWRQLTRLCQAARAAGI
jgi:hypothetical protein